jgi:hypothetical protein
MIIAHGGGDHRGVGDWELCYRVIFGSEQGDWAAAELARRRRRAA